jgi:hypothetical protein
MSDRRPILIVGDGNRDAARCHLGTETRTQLVATCGNTERDGNRDAARCHLRERGTRGLNRTAPRWARTWFQSDRSGLGARRNHGAVYFKSSTAFSPDHHPPRRSPGAIATPGSEEATSLLRCDIMNGFVTSTTPFTRKGAAHDILASPSVLLRLQRGRGSPTIDRHRFLQLGKIQSPQFCRFDNLNPPSPAHQPPDYLLQSVHLEPRGDRPVVIEVSLLRVMFCLGRAR